MHITYQPLHKYITWPKQFKSLQISNVVPSTGWNNKIVVLKKTTLQLYLKNLFEKINSGNLIM